VALGEICSRMLLPSHANNHSIDVLHPPVTSIKHVTVTTRRFHPIVSSCTQRHLAEFGKTKCSGKGQDIIFHKYKQDDYIHGVQYDVRERKEVLHSVVLLRRCLNS